MDLAQFARDCIETVWTRGEVDRIPEFYAENFYASQPRPYLNWSAMPSLEWQGRDGVRAAVESVRAVFPDYSENPAQVVASGDMVAMRMINRGTHTGKPLGDIAPSGKSFEVVDTMFVRIRDGLIAEQWGLFDGFAVAVQLGLIEPPSLTMY